MADTGMTDEVRHALEAKRKQVVNQHRVVAHLAKALAEVHDQTASYYEGGHGDTGIDFVGERSARIMETLGDILNGMDANDPTDDWVNPIFEAAHKMFPTPSVGEDSIDRLSTALAEAQRERDEARQSTERWRQGLIANWRAENPGKEFGDVHGRWRNDPPPAYENTGEWWRECIQAVVGALLQEGVPAWNGDATGIVQQMIAAQAQARAKAESALTRAREEGFAAGKAEALEEAAKLADIEVAKAVEAIGIGLIPSAVREAESWRDTARFLAEDIRALTPPQVRDGG